jgi:hypothetical protein
MALLFASGGAVARNEGAWTHDTAAFSPTFHEKAATGRHAPGDRSSITS